MNPNSTQYKAFTISVFPDSVTFTRAGSVFRFQPGYIDKLKKLVNLANGFQEFQALPESIDDPPYSIKFDEGGDLRLCDANDGFVHFTFNECDDIVESFNVALAKVRDERTLRPGPRGGGSFSSSPDPVLEGKY